MFGPLALKAVLLLLCVSIGNAQSTSDVSSTMHDTLYRRGTLKTKCEYTDFDHSTVPPIVKVAIEKLKWKLGANGTPGPEVDLTNTVFGEYRLKAYRITLMGSYWHKACEHIGRFIESLCDQAPPLRSELRDEDWWWPGFRKLREGVPKYLERDYLSENCRFFLLANHKKCVLDAIKCHAAVAGQEYPTDCDPATRLVSYHSAPLPPPHSFRYFSKESLAYSS